MEIFKHDKNREETPTVYCDVRNCVYHGGDDICTASKINVGPTHAVSSADTVCATFRPESKF